MLLEEVTSIQKYFFPSLRSVIIVKPCTSWAAPIFVLFLGTGMGVFNPHNQLHGSKKAEGCVWELAAHVDGLLFHWECWVVFPVPGMLLEVLPQVLRNSCPVHEEWLSRGRASSWQGTSVPVPLHAPNWWVSKISGQFDLEFMVYSCPLKGQNGNNRS